MVRPSLQLVGASNWVSSVQVIPRIDTWEYGTRKGLLRQSYGFLVLANSTNGILWSSNSSRSAHNPNAQLLESGNLVLKNGNDSDPENFEWQSFDYPWDTLLPGMKFGRNKVTGLDRYLSSWKSADDPSKGNFTYVIEPSGFPQLLLRNGLAIEFRHGPWNGFGLSGVPQTLSNTVYRSDFISNGSCRGAEYCMDNQSSAIGIFLGHCHFCFL